MRLWVNHELGPRWWCCDLAERCLPSPRLQDPDTCFALPATDESTEHGPHCTDCRSNAKPHYSADRIAHAIADDGASAPDNIRYTPQKVWYTHSSAHRHTHAHTCTHITQALTTTVAWTARSSPLCASQLMSVCHAPLPPPLSHNSNPHSDQQHGQHSLRLLQRSPLRGVPQERPRSCPLAPPPVCLPCSPPWPPQPPRRCLLQGRQPRRQRPPSHPPAVPQW